MGPLRPRQVWGAGVLVAALALLGIIAVAAQDDPLVAPDASASLGLGTAWKGALAAVVGIAFVGGLVLLIVSLLSQKRGKPVFRRKRHTWVVWLLALALSALVYVVIQPGERDLEDEPPVEDVVGSAGERLPGPPPAPPWALLALGGVVVGALTVAVVAGRRLRRDGESDPPAEEEVLAALDASLTDLEASDDPRAAIIAAYARLLEAFERCGLGRRVAETPGEHLRRGLDALPIRAEPAERLTELFLEARFSTHDLGDVERREAIAAFGAARDDLDVATASVGGP